MKIAELSVTENASDPIAAKLPVIAGTERPEPAATTQTLIAGQQCTGWPKAAEGGGNNAGTVRVTVSIPEPATTTAWVVSRAAAKPAT